MRNNSKPVALALALTILLGACASDEVVLAPDTRAGDQLRAEYLVGEWCGNRELTSKANSAAGHSALLNLAKHFWRLRPGGEWQKSDTGFVYSLHGEWKLQGGDRVLFKQLRGGTVIYQARFTNSGLNLYLEDSDGQFLVLSRCD